MVRVVVLNYSNLLVSVVDFLSVIYNSRNLSVWPFVGHCVIVHTKARWMKDLNKRGGPS